jgi:tetratricopeptide (TPR) repeat protein
LSIGFVVLTVTHKNLNIDEKTAEEYTKIGNNNDHISNFEKAIEAYKKAIKINPDSDGAHHNIGLAYYNLGKFEKAIEAGSLETAFVWGYYYRLSFCRN